MAEEKDVFEEIATSDNRATERPDKRVTQD